MSLKINFTILQLNLKYSWNYLRTVLIIGLYKLCAQQMCKCSEERISDLNLYIREQSDELIRGQRENCNFKYMNILLYSINTNFNARLLKHIKNWQYFTFWIPLPVFVFNAVWSLVPAMHRLSIGFKGFNWLTRRLLSGAASRCHEQFNSLG